MARKSKEDAEKTRQAVIESALDVFSEKGYARATFDEIAQRAGFTKGAVYWYFRNKADLVAALISEYVEKKHSELMPKFSKGDTLEDLLNYFTLWAEVLRDDVRYSKFNRFVICQMEWSEAVVAKVNKALAMQKDWHLEKIKEVLISCQERGELKEGIDLTKVCKIIRSTYLGIVFSSLNMFTDGDIVDNVRTGLGFLFEGLKSRKV
ncbi:MAG: TetR family transcriptional regulator [Alphaproteobacteria bacterium]|nr:TetR family transcriptional regulator [Alphaproteobacteria bacterium]